MNEGAFREGDLVRATHVFGWLPTDAIGLIVVAHIGGFVVLWAVNDGYVIDHPLSPLFKKLED